MPPRDEQHRRERAKLARKVLAQEFIEFREQYAIESKRTGRSFVDARLLLNTGLMLMELERAGYIESSGTAYRPKAR